MFCSFCRRVSYLHECKRKICPVGHIACESCDTDLEKCPECTMRFSQILCVSTVNHIPRLYITDFPQPDDDLSDSIQEIIDGLQSYETRNGDSENPEENPRFGCFEVIKQQDQPKSSANFSEEEREIMRCFKICEKPSSLENSQKFKHQKVQTSLTSNFNGSGDVISENFKSPLTPRASLASQDFYPNENPRTISSPSIINSEPTSIYEIFRTDEILQDSETAHFTSVAVSVSEISPPRSPKKKASSSAHRVRFVSVFHSDGKTPAQVEPLAVYEIEDSGANAHLPSDRARKLPRFPVRCPITNCDSFSVPSDFCNHITIDHPTIDVLKVEPHKLINLNINHKGNANLVTCQRLFLLRNKITDIGYGNFENCLPITLLSSKLSLSKTFGCANKQNRQLDEIFCIWLVGVYQFPVNYTITLWTHGRDDFEPTIITSQSASITYMSRPFNPREVASNAFNISQLELHRLTDNCRKMLSCQIVFH